MHDDEQKRTSILKKKEVTWVEVLQDVNDKNNIFGLISFFLLVRRIPFSSSQ